MREIAVVREKCQFDDKEISLIVGVSTVRLSAMEAGELLSGLVDALGEVKVLQGQEFVQLPIDIRKDKEKDNAEIRPGE